MPRYDRPVCGMFFWDDFRNDPVVRRMDSAARGIYISLLCSAWNEDPPATLPNDPRLLAHLGEAESLEAFVSLWPQIERAFCLQGDRLIQKRLKDTWERANASMLANRKRQADWLAKNKAALANGGSVHDSTTNRLTNGLLTVSQTVVKPLERRFPSGSGSGSGNTNLESTTVVEGKEWSGEKGKRNKARGTCEELEAYAVSLGLPASDGTDRFDFWESNGWKNGKTDQKIVDWKAAMRTLKKNHWMPSQKNGQGSLPIPSHFETRGERTLRIGRENAERIRNERNETEGET